MIKNIYKITSLVILSVGLLFSSCKKEFNDSSRPVYELVIKDSVGLMNLAAGLHKRFTQGRQSPMYNAPIGAAYAMDVLRTPNSGNASELELEGGGAGLPNTNSMVTGLWRENLILKAEAEVILNNLNISNTPADKVGLKGYASIFYALGVGTLCQFYEQIPLETKVNASFVSRDIALTKVISILESADLDLATLAPSAKFLGKVPAGVDIKNTVKALLARYYNMHSMITGTYNAVSGNKAISFASAASMTIKSEFRYLNTANTSENPAGVFSAAGSVFIVADSSLGMKNGLAPTPFFATDPRVGFHLTRPGTTILLKGFVAARGTSYPVYLPGEMQLIIAENQARLNAFVPCQTALNLVRQKTTDIYGLNANQPTYSGTVDQLSLLLDIYRQRRLELFMSGMEIEDSRRFNRPGPTAPNKERNRNFYPYPRDERDNNTNTPADPAI
jgi:starch-binding outer membrane protein, SusD/RagB family